MGENELLSHAQNVRKVAAQLSTERIQGWANPFVCMLTDAAAALELAAGVSQPEIDPTDAVLSSPTGGQAHG